MLFTSLSFWTGNCSLGLRSDSNSIRMEAQVVGSAKTGRENDDRYDCQAFSLSDFNLCSTLVDTLQGALHIISQKIRPLIQDQNTVPIRVKRNQLKQLDNVMIRLEKAVSEKGPLGEKSCSDMESWEPPSDKLRSLLLEEHSLEKWLSKGGPIVSYAQYYIGRCKNYNWDQRVNNIWMKTVKNLGRARRPHFGGNLFGGPSF